MPKLHLSNEQCSELALQVKAELLRIFPKGEKLLEGFAFSKELLAKPERIGAAVTIAHGEEIKKNYADTMRKQIKSDNSLKKEEKKEKLQQLDTILFFGQLLFSQQASLYFLNKGLENVKRMEGDDKLKQSLSEKIGELERLAKDEGIKSEDKKIDVLLRWQKYNEVLEELDKDLRKSRGNNEIKGEIEENLEQAKGFFSQANDLNFNNANKPSRPWSNFVNSISKYGSMVSLGAAILSIGAVAMSFIPPLTPIMAPIAVVSTGVALGVGAPIQVKDLSTMVYNKVRFNKNPTHTEVINASLLAAGVFTAGLTTVSKAAMYTGVIGGAGQTIAVQSIRTVNSLTNTGVFLKEEIDAKQDEQDEEKREQDSSSLGHK